MSNLTKQEQRSLEELEETVERGLETFVEVGRALMEIRDRRLYREEYDTFESYCRERWGWSKHRGYQLMRAADTVNLLEENVDHGQQMPTSERVARPLTKLPEDEQAEAWQEAVEAAPEKNGEKRVTAKHVKETVGRRQGNEGQGVTGAKANTEDGGTLEQMVRRAMKQDENDAKVIANELPISHQTFRRARYIVMLADDPVLGDDAREKVMDALNYMNRHRQVAHPYSMVEDLVERRFGPAANRKAGAHRSAERHMGNFMRAYGAVTHACKATESVDVPLIPAEKGEDIVAELRDAKQALQAFLSRVEEAVQ